MERVSDVPPLTQHGTVNMAHHVQLVPPLACQLSKVKLLSLQPVYALLEGGHAHAGAHHPGQQSPQAPWGHSPGHRP